MILKSAISLVLQGTPRRLNQYMKYIRELCWPSVSHISTHHLPVSTTNDLLMILNKSKIYTNNKNRLAAQVQCCLAGSLMKDLTSTRTQTNIAGRSIVCLPN